MASKYYEILAEPREGSGKGEARKLRAKGRVPAVVYGAGAEGTIHLHVDRLVLTKGLNTDAGENVIMDVKIGDDNYLVLPREIQRHPVRRDYLHLDLIAFDRKTKVTADIAVEITGEAVPGSVVTQDAFTITIDVLPLEMPESFEVSIEGLEIGEVVRVGDITLPEGVDLITDPELPVVSISEEAEEIEEEPVEAEEGEEAAEGEEAEGDDAEESSDE